MSATWRGSNPQEKMMNLAYEPKNESKNKHETEQFVNYPTKRQPSLRPIKITDSAKSLQYAPS